jgi:tellurite resistance protein
MNKIYEDLSSIQIKILSLVAWADGKITDEEKQLFNDILQVSPCSDETKIELARFIENRPDINDILLNITRIPKEIVVSVLRNAYSIAVADNEINQLELEIIDKLALQLGIKNEHIDVFHKWLELSYQVELIETKLFNTKF